MKTYNCFALTLFVVQIALSGSTANADLIFGDAVIVGHQTDTLDEVSIAFLVDVPMGEVFYLSDNEFTNPTTPLPEEPWALTVTTAISAGQVVTLTDGATWTHPSLAVSFVSGGVYSDGASAGPSLPASDPSFLFDSSDGAATVGNSTNLFSVITSGDALPSGLSAGSGAVARAGGNFRYVGTNTGTKAGLFASISDASNWEAHASAAFASNGVPGGAFTVTAVPEPGAWALMSLIGFCFVAKRRFAAE